LKKNQKSMKEVELLFKIDELKAQDIREKLKGSFIKKIREIDIYFFPPHKDFFVNDKGRENLRVRENEDKKELTYKKVIYNNGEYSYSTEKNVNVSDTKTTIEILKTVGFREHLIIDKEREIFENKNFHITIDNVKNLGFFVEIEWVGTGDNEEEGNNIFFKGVSQGGVYKIIKGLCLEKSKELGLEKLQDKGYLRLLEEKKNQGLDKVF